MLFIISSVIKQSQTGETGKNCKQPGQQTKPSRTGMSEQTKFCSLTQVYRVILQTIQPWFQDKHENKQLKTLIMEWQWPRVCPELWPPPGRWSWWGQKFGRTWIVCTLCLHSATLCPLLSTSIHLRKRCSWKCWEKKKMTKSMVTNLLKSFHSPL